MNEEFYQGMQNLQNDIQALSQENNQLRGQQQISMFGRQSDENLIKYQLDLKEELQIIEHLLKGHQLKTDNNGNTFYVEPTDERLKPFNEHGVQILLNIISFYLNRNTILSNYDEKVINWKMLDLGYEISDLIFMKYEEMGMDTKEKMKMYPMIIKEILDTVHSAYLRSLNGGERESLRTARTVNQTEPLNANSGYPQPSQKQGGFSLTRWLRP